MCMCFSSIFHTRNFKTDIWILRCEHIAHHSCPVGPKMSRPATEETPSHHLAPSAPGFVSAAPLLHTFLKLSALGLSAVHDIPERSQPCVPLSWCISPSDTLGRSFSVCLFFSFPSFSPALFFPCHYLSSPFPFSVSPFGLWMSVSHSFSH